MLDKYQASDYPVSMENDNTVGDFNDFGGRLKSARKSRGLSQTEAGVMVGLSQSGVSGWEADPSESLATVRKFCVAYDISADYILGLIDSKRRIVDEETGGDIYEIVAKLRTLSARKRAEIQDVIRVMGRWDGADSPLEGENARKMDDIGQIMEMVAMDDRLMPFAMKMLRRITNEEIDSGQAVALVRSELADLGVRLSSASMKGTLTASSPTLGIKDETETE